MKRLSFFSGAILSIFVLTGWVSPVIAASPDELVAAAKREGIIDFHAPSAIGPAAAQELGAAFNKKYGLNIKVNYHPTKGFSPDVAKVISQSAMGIAPEWDIMVLTENLHADLAQRKLLLPFDYKSLGVDSRAVQHDSGSVAMVHGLYLPTYNSQAVSAADVPRSWEDLLDAKWKDGRLAVSDATYLFALLAAGPWGEKRTAEYVKGLARQRPFLGRMAEVYTRLELREVLIASMLPNNFVHRAKTAGAPIVHAEKVDPVLILGYNVGVLRRALHPNVAHLFTAFMVTPEAQAVWDKYSGQTSAFVPGTKTHNFLRGKQTVFMGGEDPALVERLSKEYSKVLGFTK